MFKLSHTAIQSLVTCAKQGAKSEHEIEVSMRGLHPDAIKALSKSKEDQEAIRDNYILPNYIASKLYERSSKENAFELYAQEAATLLSLNDKARSEDQKRLKKSASRYFARMLSELEISNFHGNAGNRNAQKVDEVAAYRETIAKHHEKEMKAIAVKSVPDFYKTYNAALMTLTLTVDANKALVSEKLASITWDFVGKARKAIKQENTRD